MKKYFLAGIACFVLLPAAGSTIAFRQVRIPFSAWPRTIDDIAVVDMNKDGFADVVTLEGTSEGNPSKVRVFLGDRAATFTRTYTKDYGYFNMNAPIAATADLTGDKKVDIAVKSYYDYFVIFPGKGNGDLLTPISITPSGPSVPSPTHWTGSLDFNGDGKLDLAGRNSDGSMSAFRNLGNKKFEGSKFGLGQKIASVAGGDFNGDGSADVVGGSGSTLKFFKSNGDGTFGIPVISRLGENVGPHLGAADINGDGRLDLVGDSLSAGRPGWLMLGKGKGMFGNKKSFPTKPSLHYGFVAVDYTADGKLDVAAPGSKGGIDLFRGSGKGGFFPGGKLASMFNFTLNKGSKCNNRNLASGDVNGDKVADLAAIVWFPGDAFMSHTVLVYLTGVTPVSHSISNLSITTLDYSGHTAYVTGSVDFQHPEGDVRNSGHMANDGAFIEFTVVLDFGANGTRSTRLRLGGSWSTNFPGKTAGTIYFDVKIYDNTWPSGTPELSVKSFSLYDFNFVQSNVLL
jgi:hypothetical protein